jgi:G3E family GTPase
MLNKSDLAGNIEELNQKINKINPFAKRYNTTYCNAPIEEIFAKSVNKQKKLFFIPGNSDRPDVKSLVFRSAKPLKTENVKFFLNEITSKTIRLKGYILLDNTTTLTVQAIGNELYTETINAVAKQTEIIAIGYDINMQEIKVLYKSFT